MKQLRSNITIVILCIAVALSGIFSMQTPMVYAASLTNDGSSDDTSTNENTSNDSANDTANDTSTNEESSDPNTSNDNTTERQDTSDAKAVVTTIDTSVKIMQEDGTEVVDPTVGQPPAVISDPEAPAIVSNNAIVMDAKTGQILYAKNAYDACYPASITKIMTCLVALEHVNMNDIITFSYDSIWGIERDSNHIALDVGEKITAEECFYGILLQSANEASWGMAEHVAGSVSAFADMMNEKAAELGCTNTHFVNANGLHDDNHYTSCYDMALITQAAIANPVFRTIDETVYYQIPPTNLCEEPRDIWHYLKMIYPSSPYYYEYCEGGKTRFTDQAHNTLTTYAKKNDMELICVVMNCAGAANTYKDSIALYDYYFDRYTYAYPLTSYNPNQTDTSNSILNNFYHGLDHDTFHLEVDRDVTVVVPFDMKEDDLVLDVTYNNTIQGNVVGIVNIIYKDQLVGCSDITYQDLVVDGEVLSWGAVHEEKKNSIAKVIRILVIILICILAALIILVFVRNRRYRYLKRRSRSSKLHF